MKYVAMDKDNKIKELEEENSKLKEELKVTKAHLKKYTEIEYEKVSKFMIVRNIMKGVNGTSMR